MRILNRTFLLLLSLLALFSISYAGGINSLIKRASNAVSKLTGRNFGGDFGAESAIRIQESLRSLERMSLTITAPEAEKALVEVAHSLRNMKIGVDRDTANLIDNAINEVGKALDAVVELGGTIGTGLEMFGLPATLVVAESIRNVWRQINNWFIAMVLCTAAYLAVQVVPESSKAYRSLIMAVVLVVVACFLHFNTFPEESIVWIAPGNGSVAETGTTQPAKNEPLAPTHEEYADLLRRLDCADKVRPILAPLPDKNFRASTRFDDGEHAPSRSKLGSQIGWRPSDGTNGHNQYLEAFLGGNYTIREFEINSRGDQFDQRVLKFQVLYKADPFKPFQLLCATGGSDACVFDGPPGHKIALLHRNFEPFTASMVRIAPREYHGLPVIRWELHGCPVGPRVELTHDMGFPAIGYR